MGSGYAIHCKMIYHAYCLLRMKRETSGHRKCDSQNSILYIYILDNVNNLLSKSRPHNMRTRSQRHLLAPGTYCLWAPVSIIIITNFQTWPAAIARGNSTYRGSGAVTFWPKTFSLCWPASALLTSYRYFPVTRPRKLLIQNTSKNSNVPQVYVPVDG